MGLLAMAALLAPDRVRPSRTGSGSILVPDPPALAAFLVVVLAFSLLVLYIVSRAQKPRRPPTALGPRKTNRWAQAIGILLLPVMFLLSKPFREAIERLFGWDSDPGVVRPPGPTLVEGPPPGTEQSAALGMVLTIALLVLVLGTLYLIYTLSRRHPWPVAGAPVPRTLDAALTLGIEDLMHIRSPRAAVIASYSRLQDLSDHIGIRREADTPYELMDRLVSDPQVPRDSVASLTTLFERARFSTHEIDEAMRGEALRAVTEIRDRLVAHE
jgi:phosphatidylglycerophosphate synthase